MVISTALVCLALNIYHEARDQSYDGMAAVALVTLNRADHDPDQVCDVVFKPWQFSWANRLTSVSPDKRIARAPSYMPKESEAWEAAKVVANQALLGQIDSEIVATIGNSDHYYNPSKVDHPRFAYAYKPLGKVGDHIFFDSKKKPTVHYEVAFNALTN